MTAIARLLKACRPSTVARFIITIIVNSLDGEIGRWPSAHIADEDFEAIEPSRTYANTLGAIVSEGLRARIVAAILHRTPHVIFWPCVATSRCAMREFLGRLKFSLKTPATIRGASTQIAASDAALGAALATNMHVIQTVVVDNSPSAESSSFWQRALSMGECS